MSSYKGFHQIEVLAPRDLLFRVLEDYESYPALLDDFVSVRVDHVVNRRVQVSFEQALLKATLRYTLTLNHKRPSQITWTLMHGDQLEEFQGTWNLEEPTPSHTSLSLRTSMAFTGWWPDVMLNRLLDSFWIRMLQALKIQAESASAHETTNSNFSSKPGLDNSF